MGARREHACSWAQLAPMLALLAFAQAAAAQRACPALAVEAEPGVLARWPELAARVGEAFNGRADIDACARVRLGVRRGSLEVAVALPDGRSASRLLERSADVEPTLA